MWPRDPLALLGLALIVLGLVLLGLPTLIRLIQSGEVHPLIFYPIYRRGNFYVGFSPILAVIILVIWALLTLR